MSRQRIATLMWKDTFGRTECIPTDLATLLDKNRFDMRFYYLSGGPGFFAKKIEQIGYRNHFLKWENCFDVAGRVQLLRKLKNSIQI